MAGLRKRGFHSVFRRSEDKIFLALKFWISNKGFCTSNFLVYSSLVFSTLFVTSDNFIQMLYCILNFGTGRNLTVITEIRVLHVNMIQCYWITRIVTFKAKQKRLLMSVFYISLNTLNAFAKSFTFDHVGKLGRICSNSFEF